MGLNRCGIYLPERNPLEHAVYDGSAQRFQLGPARVFGRRVPAGPSRWNPVRLLAPRQLNACADESESYAMLCTNAPPV